MGAENTSPQLSAEVAEQFSVVNTHCPQVLNTKIGDIVFATLTLEQAETLVAGGFTYLERKTKPAKPVVEKKV